MLLKTELQDIHLPLSLEELHSKFPLVDINYQTSFGLDKRPASELDVHLRLYEVAKYVCDLFYNPSTYSGDVMLVTHAAGVIAAVRGFLALKHHPQSLSSNWYAPGGEGRVPVYAGVSCYHKLTAPTAEMHNHWNYNKGEDANSLPDPTRNYNWKYRPDRSKL